MEEKWCEMGFPGTPRTFVCFELGQPVDGAQKCDKTAWPGQRIPSSWHFGSYVSFGSTVSDYVALT